MSNSPSRRSWHRGQVLDALQKISQRDSGESGGLIVFVDEMGKILEGAARDGHDVYFFQQLAELASRSAGRLIVVGILHQAFEEYAHRLSREMRDEWVKVQGRFIDLSVNAAADEQISLVGRAIETTGRRPDLNGLFEGVVAQTRRQVSGDLPQLLADCWPLHPVVASLLGPISRRRFGQNQRSLFGFLNSSEPRGFQDFLRSTDEETLYLPDQLWDYLRLNLEPSIMASPDGHRWAVAIEALERCFAYGGDETDIRTLKTIALVDLFHDRSGLRPSKELIQLALPGAPVDDSLSRLLSWSLLIYRRFNDSYSVFEGSDFDIDEEVRKVLDAMDDVDFEKLNAVAALEPVVAKRHYHRTGAMRWFDLMIAPLDDITVDTSKYEPRGEAMGTFLLALPAQGESEEESRQRAREVVAAIGEWDVAIGLSPEGWSFNSLVKELLAVEQVRNTAIHLQGDGVARREVDTRLSALRGQVEAELERAFANAVWETPNNQPVCLSRTGLNRLASDLADARFHLSPIIHNELLNRSQPSSNAVAAQNYLLHRMANHEGAPRLGITGFPAEGGLFASILERGNLYRNRASGWTFESPTRGSGDPSKLKPVWNKASEYLRDHKRRAVTLDEIYDLWRRPPYGIKDGLLSVLGAAFILSKQRKLAFYRQGVFQPRITDLDMDVLAKNPADIQLRWMSLTQRSREFLSEMAEIVRELDHNNALTNLETIDVAKGLVSIYDRLPQWVGRTQQLSSNAKQVRQLFKQASDPNRLIFDDIPKVFKDRGEANSVPERVKEGLLELQGAYPEMLRRLKDVLLAELQVPNSSGAMLTELRDRAENVRNLTGNHRLEAFAMRISEFDGSDGDAESIASMAANKPPRTWVDSDIDRAVIEIAELAQQFMRAESFAHVKGRADKRHSMAVTVGIAGRPNTMYDEFVVTATDRPEIDTLIGRLEEVLGGNHQDRKHIILAALAELSTQFIDKQDIDPTAR